MLGRLAALLLLVPAAAAAQDPAARLQVTANVVRSVVVSVSGSAAAPGLRVRTAEGNVWSTSLDPAGAAGVSVAPSSEDPGYVVVTVLADAPLAPRGASAHR